jgi:iron complex transport system permease protein
MTDHSVGNAIDKPSSLPSEKTLETDASLSKQYRQFIWKRLLLLVVLAFALAFSFVADIATGPANLTFFDVLSGLIMGTQDATTDVIIWDVRLPYALMALVVGACLGLAGAEMQTVLNNPLASPFTLGVGAAATLGASLVIVLDLSWLGLSFTVLLPASAFLFASAASILILILSRSLGASVHTVVLFGIALMFGLNAVVGLLQFVADASALQQIVFWTMGSLARASMEKVAIVGSVFLICLVWSITHIWKLTALRTGEDQARSIGINVERVRLVVLLRVSLLTAIALAFVGEIGFIGLVGPHIARMMLGEDHRFFLPGSALAGALLLSLSSIASKALIPGVILPVGIVTALVGIPLFITLIMSRGRGAAV